MTNVTLKNIFNKHKGKVSDKYGNPRKGTRWSLGEGASKAAWKSAPLGSIELDNSIKAEELKKLQGFDYAGAAQLGATGLGAISSVASYFDNKELREKQINALDTNISIAREEQAHRKNFRGKTASAFE